MVIPTMLSSVRKPMANNKPVYLTTKRAEIGIVQNTRANNFTSSGGAS
jgi:hypothetical protein